MDKFIVLGAVFGGIFGSIGGYFRSNLVIGIIFGVIVGGMIGKLIKYPKQKIKTINNYPDGEDSQLNFQLKEEELDIIKSQSKTGEIKFYKEIIEEEKTVTVPLRHEELVIETFEFSGDQKISKDVIRIRLSNEEVLVTKYSVKVAEVSIYKNYITETKEVKGTIKKEQIGYEVLGMADVKDTDLIKDEQRIH